MMEDQNPNGLADELAGRLMHLQREMEDRGDTGSDKTLARALEDRIGSYQPKAGDFDKASELLSKHGL